IGPEFNQPLVRIDYPKAAAGRDSVTGFISGVEYPYGNLKTNVPVSLFEEVIGGPPCGQPVETSIKYKNRARFRETIPYVAAFDFVPIQKKLIYPDSAGYIGLSVNQDNFAEKYKI